MHVILMQSNIAIISGVDLWFRRPIDITRPAFAALATVLTEF
jgi:hypothetical protein